MKLLKKAKSFVEHGADYIVLRTTEFYSNELLLSLVTQLRTQIPGEYDLILNTGEFNEKVAERMFDSGVSGIYHALRLREGIDTPFSPERKNQNNGKRFSF